MSARERVIRVTIDPRTGRATSDDPVAERALRSLDRRPRAKVEAGTPDRPAGAPRDLDAAGTTTRRLAVARADHAQPGPGPDPDPRLARVRQQLRADRLAAI